MLLKNNNNNDPALTNMLDSGKTLRECVHAAMEAYFTHLDGQPASELYNMVMNEVEGALLAEVMEHTRDNQTKASEILGLNRGTLRKKLKHHNLL